MRFLPTLALLLLSFPAHAERLLMARSPQAFPEAMLTLQSAISARGYTVSRVQRVDVGLTSSGYKTDKYRVVFFGKADQLRMLVATDPQLAPYLPLKITIFAEQEQTLVVSFDPTILGQLATGEEERRTLASWRRDILAILDEMRETD